MAAKNKEVVLVTGGTGYIASHVIEHLVKAGYAVRTTVRDPHNKRRCAHLDRLVAAGEPVEVMAAELGKADGWDAALTGVAYVIHSASPVHMGAVKDETMLTKPAVEGTLHVLRAAANTRTVKRVVMTGSIGSVMGCRQEAIGSLAKPLDETMWADASRALPYAKSKLLSEQAAWEFVKSPEGQHLELVTLLPSVVLGPTLNGLECESLAGVTRLFRGEMPLIIQTDMPAIDVRDVAEIHVQALTLPEAAGQRFLLGQQVSSYKKCAETIAPVLRPLGYTVPTTVMPYWLAKGIAHFNKELKGGMDFLYVPVRLDPSKTLRTFKLQYRDIHRSFLDMAVSAIEHNMVPQTPRYRSARAVASVLTGDAGGVEPKAANSL